MANVEKRVKAGSVSFDDLDSMFGSVLTVRVDDDGNEIAAESELNEDLLTGMAGTMDSFLTTGAVLSDSELDSMLDRVSKMKREFEDI